MVSFSIRYSKVHKDAIYNMIKNQIICFYPSIGQIVLIPCFMHFFLSYHYASLLFYHLEKSLCLRKKMLANWAYSCVVSLAPKNQVEHLEGPAEVLSPLDERPGGHHILQSTPCRVGQCNGLSRPCDEKLQNAVLVHLIHYTRQCHGIRALHSRSHTPSLVHSVMPWSQGITGHFHYCVKVPIETK